MIVSGLKKMLLTIFRTSKYYNNKNSTQLKAIYYLVGKNCFDTLIFVSQYSTQ